MKEEQIQELVRNVQLLKAETETIEVKAARQGCPKKLCDTLSSFSNQDGGGILLFGLDEEQDFEITGVYDAADLEKQVNNKCKEMVPVIRPKVSLMELEGKPVLTAEIAGVNYADRPVYYGAKGINKGSYIRIGDSDEPMTAYEIYRYEAYRKGLHEDQQTVEDGWILKNEQRLSGFLESVKSGRLNVFEHLSDAEILRLQKIETEDKPTLAGLLVFSDYPQSAFPGLGITAIAVPGREIGDLDSEGARFLDNQRIEGSIPDMLEEAVRFTQRNMKHPTVIDDSGQRRDQPQYPIRAVREAILNALIHRDYSRHTNGTPVQLILFEDRLEIISSGGIYGGFPISRLGQESPESRNSSLIKILEFLHISENRYSGIPTMKKEMAKAGLPQPEFIDNGRQFKVILRSENPDSVPVSLTADEKRILEFCRIPHTRREIADFLDRSYSYVSTHMIRPLLEKNALVVSHTSGRQRYYLSASEIKDNKSV